MIEKLDDFKISHIYREGNMPTDHLANIGVDYVDIWWWMGKETFPIQLCELMRKDTKCIGHSYCINDDRLSNE